MVSALNGVCSALSLTPAVKQIGRVIDRHRERESLTGLGRHGQRIDSDDQTRAIDERAATVAGIDRCIGLNQRDIADLPDGADDAARHGVREHAQCRPDGDHLLSHAGMRHRAHAQHGVARDRR